MQKIARFISIIMIVSMLLAACAPQATPTAPPATSAPAIEQPTSAPLATQPAATTAPEPTSAPSSPAAKKAITVQEGANDPRSIDPQKAVDSRDWTLLTQLFPSLVIMDDQNTKILPSMAKTWEVSDDGLTYTFHLLEKVPWVHYNAQTDAVEEVKDDSGNVRYVTANDFVFGFLRALDPETASPAAYILAPYIGGANDYNATPVTDTAKLAENKAKVGVKAVDEYTFQVIAPEKIGFALGIYSIINAHATPEWAISNSGDTWTEPENINTFGPYALKSWEHEASMVMIKNPFWPGSEGVQQPKIDEITFRFIDESVGLREFEAGTIDTTIVAGDQIERLKVDANLSSQLKIAPWNCTQAWGFNTMKPPFNNVHMRKAFNFAVDRESLVTNVTAGGEIPAVFFTPPSIAEAPSATDAVKVLTNFDAAKAKEELALGLKDLGFTSVDQLPKITVEFGTSQILSAVAQALQAMWQESLGIKVDLSQVDNTVYWSKQEKDPGMIFRAGWCPDYNDANNYLRDVYRSDSIYNYGKWTNAEFDKLVDQARVETDPAKRLEMYTQAETLLSIDDAGTMVLYYPARAQLTKSTIQRTYSLAGTEYFWDWDVTQ